MNRWILLASVCLFPSIQARADSPAKTDYTVTVELSVNETGAVDAAKVIDSEDKILNGIAEQSGRAMKLQPRLQDGVAVKYKVQAPMFFPVEGDGGPEAQKVPMPTLRKPVNPDFPRQLRDDDKKRHEKRPGNGSSCRSWSTEVVRYIAVAFEPNGHKAEWGWYVAPRPCLFNYVVSAFHVP
jgi:hypothetical protein